MFAKAPFLTQEMHRLHRPLREQARSYKSSRITCRSELVRESAIPDAGNASTAPPSSRTSSYKSSRITCRSELVRESAIPDAGNASTAPPSSRTSSLLQKLADNL
ncbi:hypothetical protein DND58_08920 [Pseudomonas syringae pv. pisi]|nr:hypothetical protein DND62_02840 [Pseudomonas syringae pv. pisi]PYD31754.1 hypothetical protein DND58_08920 [Pseudomonas syringae pv. pisi]